MKWMKAAAPFTLSLMLLTGCANTDQDLNNSENDIPLGYYSNERHEKESTGNARVLGNQDNDGPLTEAMDHTFGLEGQQNRANASNINDQTSLGNNEESYNTELADKINNAALKVKNVKDVRTVVYNDNVLVALEVNNRKTITTTKADVRKNIGSYIKGKETSIVTDKGIFLNIDSINKGIRKRLPEKTIDRNKRNIIKKADPTSNL
ncbi:YhcN/YlaJ family sporulation lipoprotein [Bacillus sp. Au-Bac7]|uniref:YhcN/YlaJ family sporulation lipoprotein n=1 Tax=Bacillus sp. Au-Bac7 TaxID=2906458 RepID=UPI001E64BC46|nr:YhcN/YlaJ family sporulation lipoprotein [Bacillus sp. Au-Bac7]MCE4046901.1 YhcN/YlaJ family sporulation lipoprotein [Bacillus sp. Au-Bac7]